MEATLGMEPIGTVSRSADAVTVQIAVTYRPGLRQLDRFSHVIVLWWASGHDAPQSRSIMTTQLPYAPGVEAGVFACRSEYRPNPIALTVCKILEVDEQEGRIVVGDIDAFDGTQILDLKPYFPVCDRVKNATIPHWLAGWPNWLPERGLGLEY